MSELEGELGRTGGRVSELEGELGRTGSAVAALAQELTDTRQAAIQNLQSMSERFLADFDAVRAQLRQSELSLESLQAEQALHDAEWFDRLSGVQSELETAREQVRARAEAAERSHAEGAAMRDARIEQMQRELETVLQSKSWRLTAPFRDTRRTIGRAKHGFATQLEHPFRRLYLALPISSQRRWQLKSAGFRSFSWLMRGTASYKHWEGTVARAQPQIRALDPSFELGEPGSLELPHSADPVVSVIIPVFGELAHTTRCLASIARHAPETPIEVIVVDDRSTDDTPTSLAAVRGAPTASRTR